MASKPRSDDPRMKGRTIKRLADSLPEEPAAFFCPRCLCCEKHCCCERELSEYDAETSLPDLLDFEVGKCPGCV
jgi:hypothetical protein